MLQKCEVIRWMEIDTWHETNAKAWHRRASWMKAQKWRGEIKRKKSTSKERHVRMWIRSKMLYFDHISREHTFEFFIIMKSLFGFWFAFLRILCFYIKVFLSVPKSSGFFIQMFLRISTHLDFFKVMVISFKSCEYFWYNHENIIAHLEKITHSFTLCRFCQLIISVRKSLSPKTFSAKSCKQHFPKTSLCARSVDTMMWSWAFFHVCDTCHVVFIPSGITRWILNAKQILSLLTRKSQYFTQNECVFIKKIHHARLAAFSSAAHQNEATDNDFGDFLILLFCHKMR